MQANSRSFLANRWTGTWTGRIQLVNTIVFVALMAKSRALFLPSMSALIDFGAKDPVGLARGEWWRLVSPVFIHVGLIHFLVNSYMLRVIGEQIERFVGGPWFLAIYVGAGIAGNVASAVFSPSLSAGASGALFGLLGVGFCIERAAYRHFSSVEGTPRVRRAYAATIAVNLGFGLLIPFIDNSAHVGGLLTGALLGTAMLNVRPNRFQRRRLRLAAALLITFAVAVGGGLYFALSPTYLAGLAERSGDHAKDPEEQYVHFSQALAIDEANSRVVIKRALAAFDSGMPQVGWRDVRYLVALGDLEGVLAVADRLASAGRLEEAWEIRRLVRAGPSL